MKIKHPSILIFFLIALLPVIYDQPLSGIDILSDFQCLYRERLQQICAWSDNKVAHAGSSSGTLYNPVVDSSMTWREAVINKTGGTKVPLHIINNLEVVDVIYYSYDGKIHKGQVVIHKRLVNDIHKVFRVIFRKKFPIYSVIPISYGKFDWNDNKSMAANNTSAFNYRNVAGEKKLSKHAYGFAVDINPLHNPYIKGKRVLPPDAEYIKKRAGTLTPGCPIVKIFLKLGWSWGGNWVKSKDYQHFEKVP